MCHHCVRALESELPVLALHLPWTNDLLFSELIFKIGEITEIIFEVVNDDYRR